MSPRIALPSGGMLMLMLLCDAVVAPLCAQGLLEDQVTVELAEGVTMEFVRIAPGTFTMGDKNGDNDEKLVREVDVRRPFFLGKTEVTQAQWQALMGNNPSRFRDPTHPVENVNWYDCQEFIRRLEEKFGHLGRRFRLPTEAEWEYACRAGNPATFSFGGQSSDLKDFAWYDENSQGTTHPVGQKDANAWGLHDMHGNVWEWCSDYYGKDYAIYSPREDPRGPTSGSKRVRRGGSQYYPAYNLRSGHRNFHDPSYHSDQTGFRVLCER